MNDELFLGNALNAIDLKGRVSIPASFRDVLAARSDGRVLVVAPAERDECVIGYDSGHPAKIDAELDARFAGDYSGKRDDLWRATLGASDRLPIDDNGRLIVSAAMRDAGLDRLALFWGMGKHFEIWDPQRFLARPGNDPRVVRTVERLLAVRGAT